MLYEYACITVDNGSNNTVGAVVNLLIKLEANLRKTALIWSVVFVAYSMVYRGILISLIHRTTTQFSSNRSQQVMMDGCLSKLFNAVAGVLQGGFGGSLLFLLYTLALF